MALFNKEGIFDPDEIMKDKKKPHKNSPDLDSFRAAVLNSNFA
jgi:hypothetical protein